MIQYIQSNQQFDTALMQKELMHLSGGNWKAHYNTSHYEGDWSILPLRSINGSIDNTIAIHASASNLLYADTILLNHCPYIQSVIASFNCEKTSVRLMKLNAGALIKEHTDLDMNIEAGEARFHIPVQTNSDVAFYIMEDLIPMQEGECWYLNLSLPHKVHNRSNTDRIHLVIDVIVNDWVTNLLNQPGLKRKDIENIQEKTLGEEDHKKIIAELRYQNTTTSLQLADKMESTYIVSNPMPTESEYFKRAIAFIESIGIILKYESINMETFLPGLLIHNGSIYIDIEKLRYPGDILHEAGHIAVVSSIERKGLSGDTIAFRENQEAEEMMAIAWSYAACRHLDIDPYFVFHETGYGGGGHHIADQFGEGNYFGVPMLQYTGLTMDAKTAKEQNAQAYPAMAKWMRD